MQAECRALAEQDAPEVDPALSRAVAALRDRPVLYKYCAEEVRVCDTCDMCVCACVCGRAGEGGCLCPPMWCGWAVCACEKPYTCCCVHMRMHTHYTLAHHAHTYAHMHTHTYAQTYAHAHAHTCLHTHALPLPLPTLLPKVAAARNAALFQRFIVALTRGGPGGLPRPIEMHAHDPRRYVADMLAWVHQVCVHV